MAGILHGQPMESFTIFSLVTEKQDLLAHCCGDNSPEDFLAMAAVLSLKEIQWRMGLGRSFDLKLSWNNFWLNRKKKKKKEIQYLCIFDSLIFKKPIKKCL